MTVKIWEEGVSYDGSTYVRLIDKWGGVHLCVVDGEGDVVDFGLIILIDNNGIERCLNFNDENQIEIKAKNGYVKQRKEFV